MKHYYLVLIITLIFSSSCQEHTNAKIEPTFSVDLITERGSPNHIHYANVPARFSLQVKHPSTSLIKIQVYASTPAGKGEIVINGEKSTDRCISISEGDTPVSYFPLSLGEHRLQFRLFNDEGYTAEVVYSLSVPEYSIAITPNDIAVIYEQEPISIGFHIAERGNEQGNGLRADLTVSKGGGEVSMPVPSLPNQDGSMSYHIQTGENEIRYLPYSSGEHIVKIRFTNSYGYQQFFNMTLYAFPASIKNEIEF